MKSVRCAVVLVLIFATGCLGTIVETPRRQGKAFTDTRIHILAAPFRIDAHACDKGVASASSFIPLWGVAVGILTLGILVPKTVIYSCVQGG